MEDDEALNPVGVGLFGARAEVAEAAGLSDAVRESRRRRCVGHALTGAKRIPGRCRSECARVALGSGMFCVPQVVPSGGNRDRRNCAPCGVRCRIKLPPRAAYLDGGPSMQ